jgi:cobalamin biosynthetic protein CobC
MYRPESLSPNTALPPHGGDLAWARAAFPLAPQPWIDLSTGINPWSYPVVIDPHAWSRLPSPAALAALTAAARRYYRVSPEAAVVPVAGIELAIRLLPHFLRGEGAVSIIGPTYSSHTDAWWQAGHDIRLVNGLGDLAADSSLCVAVSPNNPDGRVTPAAMLAETAAALSGKGGYLIADRSFADIEAVPAALAPSPGLIELRSFGKFFGLPGLRLGFLIGPQEALGSLARALGAWPLNAAALDVGLAAFADQAWQATTRAKLRTAGDALQALLRRHGTVRGGTDLFQLLQLEEASTLFQHLGARGILARVFDYDPRWIRFGLPPDQAGFARLEVCLAEFSGTRR